MKKTKGDWLPGTNICKNTELLDAIFDNRRSFNSIKPLIKKWAGKVFQWEGDNLFLDEDINEANQNTLFNVTVDEAYERLVWFTNGIEKHNVPVVGGCTICDDFLELYFGD